MSKKNTDPVEKPTLAEFADRRAIAERLLRSYDLQSLVDLLIPIHSAAAESNLTALASLKRRTKSKILRRLIEAAQDACESGDYIAAANAVCGIGYTAADTQSFEGVRYYDERQAIIHGHTHRREITIPVMDKIESRLVWEFITPGGKRRLSVEVTGKVGEHGQVCYVKMWDGGHVAAKLQIDDINRESEVSHAR